MVAVFVLLVVFVVVGVLGGSGKRGQTDDGGCAEGAAGRACGVRARKGQDESGGEG